MIQPHPTKYHSPGRCIYAFREPHEGKLSGEHIIPYGLGSDFEIWKASCRTCAKATGKLEQDFLRRSYNSLRVYLGLRSRRPQGRPKTSSQGIRTKEGLLVTVELPPGVHPFVVGFFDLGCSSILTDTPDMPPPENVPMQFTFVRGVRETFDILNAHTIRVPDPFSYLVVVRAVAKIAHAFASAELSPDAFTPVLIPLILGDASDSDMLRLASRYIGGSPLNDSNELSKNLHELSLEELTHNGAHYVLVTVWLFSSVTSVRYRAVVGEATISNISSRKKVVQSL